MVILTVQVANAQPERLVKEADNAFQNEAYYGAIDKYKKAYAKVNAADEKARLLFQIAESYRMVLDYKQQVVWYNKALKAQYDGPEAFLYLAQAYHREGDFNQAIEFYEKYQTKQPDDTRADIGIAQCEFAKEMRKNPTRYQAQNEVLLNSPEYDFSPGWFPDEEEYNTILFGSSRQGSQGSEIDERTGESFQDIFLATRDQKGKWSEPERLTYRVNTLHSEATPYVTKDGNMLFFTRCEHTQEENKGCDIFMARKTEKSWSTAQKISLKNDQSSDNTTVGHPAFNEDETFIIFASDMPGGFGGRDLWMAPFDKASRTAGPSVNLGSSINTPGDEMFPFLRKDGVLFFASNGHMGMGGLDIFKAESAGDKEWSNPENMGAPINSTGHDFGIIWEGDSERGFFSSDRQGGSGKDDIYSFSLPPLVFALEGVVYDKDSQMPVPEAEITVVGSDGASFQASTDGSGAFTFEKKGEERYINPATNYSIEVSKPQYLVAKDQISTVGLNESTTFLKEYFITFTAPDKAIEFPEVRYAYNKAELQVNENVNSLDSLDYLYSTLTDNPTIVIELQAHTDSRGGDGYNLDLSQRRAQSCVDYLISKGIPRERMVAKGYGERKTRISDQQIAAMGSEEEREAAHQKNRRTEFTVLNFDYIPEDPTDN
ncbi:MAG: OmpA family protein [Cryomorphaceae bacterium]|nr:OmpA family protein [Flavobacteriales bacterium]